MTEYNRTAAAQALLDEVESYCLRTATPEGSIGHALFLHPGFVGLLRKRLTVSVEKEIAVRAFIYNDHPEGYRGPLPKTHSNGTQPVATRASSPAARRKEDEELMSQPRPISEAPRRGLIRNANVGGTMQDSSAPCFYCGVRADVGCKHRPASGVVPASLAAQAQDEKRARFNKAGGNNPFGFFGKGSNVARNLETAKERLGLGLRRDD